MTKEKKNMMMLKKITILFLLYLCLDYSLCQGTWMTITNPNNPLRAKSVGFTLGNHGYIAGGMIHFAPPWNVQKDFQEYNPESDSWSNKPDLPEPVREAVAFTTGSNVFITTGGDSTTYGLISKLYSWDTLSGLWSIVGPIPSEIKRIRAVGFSIGNKGYIATGIDSNAYILLNDIWEYDPGMNVWGRKADFPGIGRYDAACFVIGGKGYITTGNAFGIPGSTNDLWEFDPVANTWTERAPFPGQEISGAVGFSIGDYGYIITGATIDHLFSMEVWQYDPSQDSWTNISTFPGNPRQYATGFVIGDQGYIIYGWYGGFPFSDNWKFTPPPAGDANLAETEFSLNPNPFTGILRLSFPQKYDGNVNVLISDISGKIVFKDNFPKTKGASVKEWDLSFLKPGLFFIKISNKRQIPWIGKVLKE